MTVKELKSTFQYGMHGCGFFKGVSHANALEAVLYWQSQGVKVFEVDVAKTLDEKYVALSHSMKPYDLAKVEINPYRDVADDKYTEKWFIQKKLCERSTDGLTPMNLAKIVALLAENSQMVVMFDLWGLWSNECTYAFSKQLINIASDDIRKRCILEVYNKIMLSGIREADPELNVMYCVHGTKAKDFDGNVSPEILKAIGVDVISYPWACTKEHSGELERYHKEGFTIFSLSRNNRHSNEMRRAGVNVNLVDYLYKPCNIFKYVFDKVRYKLKRNYCLNKSDMQEMTLEDVHGVILEMMKEIHEFCVENEIEYSLAYGSLLGAIRHKGFIPWDDDIDIWMTRPNFEKFTKTFKSKKGYRHMSVYDKDCLLAFDRVYETEHTYVKNMTKACNGETGVWIDIMPLDYVPDDKKLREEQYQQFVSLVREMDYVRGWRSNLEFRRYIRIIKSVVKLAIKGKMGFLQQKTITKMHNAELEKMKEYNDTPTSHYCFFQCGVIYRHEPQELLPAQCFASYKLAKFEDTEFMIVQDYDKLLRVLFGDYMTPPPVDKRQKSHGICFWK